MGPHVAGGDDEDDEGALAVDIHRSTFVFLVVDPQAIDAVDQADIALPSSSDSSTCSSVCFRSAACSLLPLLLATTTYYLRQTPPRWVDRPARSTLVWKLDQPRRLVRGVLPYRSLVACREGTQFKRGGDGGSIL